MSDLESRIYAALDDIESSEISGSDAAMNNIESILRDVLRSIS